MQDIKDCLKKVIHDLYGLDFDPELTPSPENISADYSSNAPLKLAKELHKSPMEIATRVAEHAFFENISRFASSETYIPDGAEKAAQGADFPGRPVYDVEDEQVHSEKGSSARTRVSISAPGFLNFTLSDDYLSDVINALDVDSSSQNYKGKTVVCEFSDPNPFKVLHVGHLYTSIVGNAISNLYEYAGAKVIRANFGGDVGLHVAKTMYVLKNKPIDELTIEDIAKCYIEGTTVYEEDETAREEITKLNKEIYRINTEGHVVPSDLIRTGDGSGRGPQNVLRSKNFREGEEPAGPVRDYSDLANLYWRGRELSYDYFNQFYDSIGVRFDKFYPESTVADLGLKKVKEQLEKGVYEYSDGAVIFNGEKYGLHTRVFINKEGVPTYETKDVGLIFQKYADYHFDKSVVITGNEQKDYMAVVLKSIEQYAPDLVKKTTHLTHGLVKLPGNVKMSSRKGNFLKAVDVLNMVREALKNEYNSTDETVVLAATKYAFLKYKMGGDIIFDPKESVKMTGNSGPYLLYSCVRAKKVLARGAENTQRASIRDNGSEIASEPRNDGRERSGSRVCVFAPEERNLSKKLIECKTVLDESVNELAPHKLANFLYELSQTFSRFYETCPVIGCDHESDRLKLVKAYLDTMTHGLNILGINIPEEM